MASDPFAPLNPSDSGLLDGLASGGGDLPGYGNVAGSSSERRRRQTTASTPPAREEYEAPAPTPARSEAPEASLADAPLPPGFMTRLRALVDEL